YALVVWKIPVDIVSGLFNIWFLATQGMSGTMLAQLNKKLCGKCDYVHCISQELEKKEVSEKEQMPYGSYLFVDSADNKQPERWLPVYIAPVYCGLLQFSSEPQNHSFLVLMCDPGAASYPWRKSHFLRPRSSQSPWEEDQRATSHPQKKRTQEQPVILRGRGSRNSQSTQWKRTQEHPDTIGTRNLPCPPSKAEMGRHQCKSTYNNIKNKTSPESTPPPTRRPEHCNVDKAEENDLKNSIMKIIEENLEGKMKNAIKEIEEKNKQKIGGKE
ncbi:hypothetical protein STEG23_009561, partial [Scotinomys teguina]